MDEAKNYLLLPQERPLMQGPRTRPRKPIRCGEVLFAGEFKNLCLHIETVKDYCRKLVLFDLFQLFAN